MYKILQKCLPPEIPNTYKQFRNQYKSRVRINCNVHEHKPIIKMSPLCVNIRNH